MRRSIYEIVPEEYKKVITYFENHNDNRTKVIAEKLNIHYNKVSYYLDHFLSRKANYYGFEVQEVKS